MTALTQLGPYRWLDLDQVEDVHVWSTGAGREVVLSTRSGGQCSVVIPGTKDAQDVAERDRLVDSWLAAHLGSILTVEPRDIPGACGERDCPEPHP